MEETMQQRRGSWEFTDAYKVEVVALCEKGDRSIAQVAHDLDLSETSVIAKLAWAEHDRLQSAGRRSLGGPTSVRVRL